MSRRHPGSALLALARQCCDPQDIDEVLLPVVGDLQFELASCADRSLPVRSWVRFRGYVAFFQGFWLSLVLHQRRSPMYSKALGWLRLLLAIPAALAASFVVQYGASELFSRVLVHPGPGGIAEGIWLVRVIITPLMSAAFLWTMYLVAPRERRRTVALAALIVVALWGTILVTAAVRPGSGFDAWLVAMGIGGWAGGMLAYWSTRVAERSWALAQA